MRSRSHSRSGSRAKSPSPTLGATNQKQKSTKFPQISGLQDETFSATSSPVSPPSPTLTVGVCSLQGKRPYQEDEYSIRQFLKPLGATDGDTDPDTHFFGLFDGHAGGRCSKHISTFLANTLATDPAYYSNLPQALKRSFHTTNEQFLKVAEKMKLHDGSTGICSILRDNKLVVANVGDCRAVIVSQGRPVQMSIDQKPTNPEEQKRIASLGGTIVYCMGVARVNRILAVSRAFGNRTLKSVIRPDCELMQRDLAPGDDYLVMASDGMWDVLKNKDVCDFCYAQYLGGNPQSIADELANTALVRGSMDNITCIVVKLTDYVTRMTNASVGKSLFASAPAALSGMERAVSFNHALSRSDSLGGMQESATLASNNGAGQQTHVRKLSNNDLSNLPMKQFSLGSIKSSDLPNPVDFTTPTGSKKFLGTGSLSSSGSSSGSGKLAGPSVGQQVLQELGYQSSRPSTTHMGALTSPTINTGKGFFQPISSIGGYRYESPTVNFAAIESPSIGALTSEDSIIFPPGGLDDEELVEGAVSAAHAQYSGIGANLSIKLTSRQQTLLNTSYQEGSKSAGSTPSPSPATVAEGNPLSMLNSPSVGGKKAHHVRSWSNGIPPLSSLPLKSPQVLSWTDSPQSSSGVGIAGQGSASSADAGGMLFDKQHPHQQQQQQQQTSPNGKHMPSITGLALRRNF